MKLTKTIMVSLTVVFLLGGMACSAPTGNDPDDNQVLTEGDAYTCTLTGYTYMGGGSYYDSSTQPYYFLAQPMEYIYNETTDMWGFAWVKFTDIGTETVEKAYLNLDLLGVGGMNIQDASTDYPGIVDIYSPGDTNVASFTDADIRATMHSTLKATPSDYILVEDFTMPSNGSYAIEITDIYNAWVSGEQTNNGLILQSDSENDSGAIGAVGTKFASLDTSDGSLGTVPSISTYIYE